VRQRGTRQEQDLRYVSAAAAALFLFLSLLALGSVVKG
jgi:hypothetical protein